MKRPEENAEGRTIEGTSVFRPQPASLESAEHGRVSPDQGQSIYKISRGHLWWLNMVEEASQRREAWKFGWARLEDSLG